jgi:hypothetical protein
MDISNVSTTLNVYMPSSISGTSGPQVSGSQDPDNDGDAGRVHHHGHGGGQMRQAMMQALQSLGLSMPQQSASGATGSSSDRDGDGDGGNSGAGKVKHDMRQFMHALFQAVKGENGAGANESQTGASGTSNSFSAGLSALISQVSNGSAPAPLQDAFNSLAADLQGGTNAATNGSTGTPSVTLQNVLSQLQLNLGYGSGASGAASTGNVISAQA